MRAGLTALALCAACPALAQEMAPLPSYDSYAEAGDEAGFVNALVRCVALVQTLKDNGLMSPADRTDDTVMIRARETMVFMSASQRGDVVLAPELPHAAYAAALGDLEGRAILAHPLIEHDLSACGALIGAAG